MSDGAGTLMHVGEFESGKTIADEAHQSGAYDGVLQHGSVYEALDALRKASKEELQSIRTIVVEDRIPLIKASPDSEARAQILLNGGEAPNNEMRAVFLAGKIKQIYKEQRLEVPPVIMGTDIKENRDRQFPNINGVYEYSDCAPNFAHELSRMSNAIAARSRA